MKALLTLAAALALASAQADPLRDPTRPPQAALARAAAAEPPPLVSAVFDAGDRRRAIFNGQLVRAGDAVGAYRIEDVLADGVRYRHAGTVHELHLPHVDPVKKPTTAPVRGSEGP